MRWFKHFSDAKTSESLEYLQSKEGFAGIGRWWRLLEVIAEKMDKTNRCHAEHSTQEWCRLLKLKKKKLLSFLELTKNQLKTKVVYSGNVIRIEVPKLLELRDNYTKDYQAPTKRLGSKEVEVEVDKDLICKTSLSNAGSKDTPHSSGPTPLEQVKSAYAQYSPVLWRSIGIRAKANDHFEQLLVTGHKPEDIIACVKENPNSEPWKIKPIKQIVKGEWLKKELEAYKFKSNEVKP